MGTAIVALPSKGSGVYKYSSEKVPHLTILFLGDQTANAEVIDMASFVKHAASTLRPFGLTVESRGTLGPQDADVLFFEKNNQWDIEDLLEFRANLLKNSLIKQAYSSVEQYPEWTPHLTMGFPETPAIAVEDDGYHSWQNYIDFDRIALWVDDYAGPEFKLNYNSMVSPGGDMTGPTLAMSASTGLDFLAHYGVKGMKWGVRKNDAGPTDVVLKPTKDGAYVKTDGGARQPASTDAIDAAVARQKAKKSTTDSLTNDELRQVVTRMQLEKSYQDLAFSSDRRSVGKKFVDGLLGKGRYGGSEKRKYDDPTEKYGRELSVQVKQIMEERAAKE